MAILLRFTLLVAIMQNVVAANALAAELDFFVLGVITSTEADQGVALLKHKPTGKIQAHRVGAAVGPMTIVEIQRKFVILSKNDKKYKVDVGTDDPTDYRPTLPVESEAPPKLVVEEGIEKAGNELRIQASLREKMVNESLATILMQAAAEPYIKNGEILGFKLWDIEKDSIYEKAGFTNGDLITHINGMPLTDAGNAIKTLRSLKNAADVEVTYVTGGIEKSLKVLVQ